MRFIAKRGLLFLFVPGLAMVLGMVGTMAMEKQEKSSRLEELRSVQSAVIVMMVDNGLRRLSNPVTEPTADMGAFPDAITSPLAKGLSLQDKPGYILFAHDRWADESHTATISYISVARTQWTYTVTADATVTQGPRR